MPAKISPHTLINATLVAAVVSVAGPLSVAGAEDQPKGKEKCYGVAKAGENGCQAMSGAHTCGGCSSADYRGEDWKWVPSGSCLSMGGQLQAFDGFGKQAASTPIPKKP